MSTPSMQAKARFFDANHYLRSNADVNAMVNERMSGFRPSAQGLVPAEQQAASERTRIAFAHFRERGEAEGRAPNAFFDPRAYLAANADVRASGLSPFEHFNRFGAAEGRLPAPGTGLGAAPGMAFLLPAPPAAGAGPVQASTAWAPALQAGLLPRAAGGAGAFVFPADPAAGGFAVELHRPDAGAAVFLGPEPRFA